MGMTFSIDEGFLPATLTAPPMTDEEFAEFCSEHPDLFFEVNADGEIIVMPPTQSTGGARNMRVSGQLDAWADADGRGIATDSSTGFVLPNGARRSPDAAWTDRARIEELSPESRDRYWHLAPDFVIELKSKSDRLKVLREKMHEWIANGARLGWLIDPESRTVEIYRPGAGPQCLEDPSSVEGEGPVAGFHLDLTRVWNPFAR
jgi:Uma2 family endonuclease